MCCLIFKYSVYFRLLAAARLPFPLFGCCCCWQGHQIAVKELVLSVCPGCSGRNGQGTLRSCWGFGGASPTRLHKDSFVSQCVQLACVPYTTHIRIQSVCIVKAGGAASFWFILLLAYKNFNSFTFC